MKVWCGCDNRECGAGGSKVCADQHEKCPARYVRVKRRDEKDEIEPERRKS